jgi:hypothetical protein
MMKKEMVEKPNSRIIVFQKLQWNAMFVKQFEPQIATYRNAYICMSHIFRRPRYNLQVHRLPCLPLQDMLCMTKSRTWGLQSLERGSMEKVTLSRFLRHTGRTRNKQVWSTNVTILALAVGYSQVAGLGDLTGSILTEWWRQFRVTHSIWSDEDRRCQDSQGPQL